MINYKTTITQVTVHKADESAVFGESAIRISLDDEGAGEFLIIEQDGSGIRVDPEELDIIIAEAKKLISQLNYEN